MKIFVAFTLLAFVFCAAAATFDGRWTDTFWGENDSYCCTRPNNKLHCVYAQIGIVDGTISGNTASGKFYEGGGDVTPCPTGTFSWTLNEAGDAFTGVYTCDDENNAESYTWSESRLSSVVPTAAQCGARTTSRDISGRNAARTVSICNGNGAYQSSFSDSNIVGYEEGLTFSSGSIGSGFYYLNDGSDNFSIGISLYFVLEDGTQANLYRETAVYGERPANFDLDTEPSGGHGYTIDTWSSSNPSNSDCNQNLEVKDDFLAQYSTGSTGSPSTFSPSTGVSSASPGSPSTAASPGSGSSSSASTLAVSALMSFVAIFTALF